MESIDWLPRKLVERLHKAATAIQAVLGDHLQAVTLVGAAANPERHDRARAPELLAVVGQLSVDDLRGMAAKLHDRALRDVRIRILTQDELLTSADVFSVEIAEYRVHHVVLIGEDPFAEIEIGQVDLRRSVEQGLRGLGRRARNRVLSGIGTDGRRGDPQQALAQSIEQLLTLTRQTLTVLDGEAPLAEGAMLDRLGKLLSVELGWLRKSLAQIRAGKGLADPLSLTCQLLELIHPMVDAIDGAEVAV